MGAAAGEYTVLLKLSTSVFTFNGTLLEFLAWKLGPRGRAGGPAGTGWSGGRLTSVIGTSVEPFVGEDGRLMPALVGLARDIGGIPWRMLSKSILNRSLGSMSPAGITNDGDS